MNRSNVDEAHAAFPRGPKVIVVIPAHRLEVNVPVPNPYLALSCEERGDRLKEVSHDYLRVDVAAEKTSIARHVREIRRDVCEAPEIYEQLFVPE